MSVAQLGINIVSDSAKLAVSNLEALVPAAQRVENAVDKMSASVSQDLRGVDAAADKMASTVGRSLRDVEASTTAAGKGFTGLSGGAISNVSFQLQDFAVQVGAGTSASTALAQQLPQLLGGFGAVGAVLGAVAAIGIPVAAMFFNMGDGAESLEDRLDDLAGAVQRVDDTMELAAGGTSAMIDRYGDASVAVRGLVAAMAELSMAQASASATALVKDQFAEFRNLASTASSMGDDLLLSNFASDIQAATVGAERLRQALNSTVPEAENLQRLMGDVEGARTFEEQAAALAAMRDALGEMRDEFGALTPEAAALLQPIVDTENKIREAARSSDLLADSMSGATSAIDAAGAAASNVANEIARAVGNLMSLTAGAASALKEAQIRSQFRGDPIGEAGALAGNRFDSAAGDLSGTDPILRNEMQRQREAMIATEKERARIQEDLADWNKAQSAANKKSGRGGKSDAEKEAEKQNRELDKLDKALDRVNEGLALEAAMIGQSDVARRVANLTRQASIKIGSDEYESIQRQVQAIDAATRQYERLQEVQDYVAQTGADLFTSAISGADSFADALRGVAAELGQMLANQAFIQLVGGGKSNAPGMAGGIFGALLGGLGGFGKSAMPATGSFAGGFAPAVYASGTNFHPGGPAIVNDRGGEIINLPRGSQVIPHDISREMARGGRQEVDVRVSVDNEGGIRTYVKRETSKSEGRAVNRSVGAVRRGDASSRHFWKR
jgi:hypothetical protein